MDTYVYRIGNNLYVNLTNRCSNRCTFCVRNGKETFEGYALWLRDGEPSAGQIERALGECDCDEVVFCGFGEPTYRLHDMLEVCDYVHAHQKKTRLNTNGHGSVINGRDIAPELVGKLDGINISLNASEAKLYDKICRPINPDTAFDSMLFFASACRENGLNCWFSVVVCIGVAVFGACRGVAARVGIPLRVRPTIE